MTETDPAEYEFADRNLARFVAQWLQEVQHPDAPSRGLLDHIAEGYSYGGHFLMANIGPAATDPGADEQTLVLYSVLAAFQNDEFAGASSWTGEDDHVRRAFAHARHLGESGVARNLLGSVARRSMREPVPELDKMIANSLGNDPSRQAAHDRLMASIVDRDIRGARLLDSSLSVDEFILGSTGPT